MSLQELERVKRLALSPDATMWDLRQSLCRVAVEHEWLMHAHAALREKGPSSPICDIKQHNAVSRNGLAEGSAPAGVPTSSAPMTGSIYALVRRLTRWAA